MQRRWAWGSVAIAAIVIAVIAYAWIGGGRQPVHAIAVPVLPEALR